MKLILGAKGHANDLRAVILARLGFAVEDIAATTHLTENQVRYRMKLLGIKLSDYRKMRSYIAKRIAAGADPYPIVKEQTLKLIDKTLTT